MTFSKQHETSFAHDQGFVNPLGVAFELHLGSRAESMRHLPQIVGPLQLPALQDASPVVASRSAQHHANPAQRFLLGKCCSESWQPGNRESVESSEPYKFNQSCSTSDRQRGASVSTASDRFLQNMTILT
eukprot:CAMPEP_0202834472 /NCGR_PEP_ID=MMETSP1389-20130828/32283_1 /ASSEMBLY_ACC=CAM_ASM_000865 /TAXON_ID=302021 /ORGANISM="Rhodomonas sp., Strain CCMP768" /LENGTH=129 /DNA_ID=CAMNT_0049509671 /DNA_START=518 /DNA_END=903 /DNA_ORIENTATION=-